ncbi:hypothetical protein OCC_01184 [Thermococcus litoralis DSM 5473]|uniref:TsaA-like domain-containing protein n=1 Tax=Thermococcus litoralis (strain ATCC 51850 / DSM 5473 / JCM 8560 / NS-C) TaxID=523849 RepID=H3ZLR1_THELN|nr:tRNA (N6-threonylcarbamoyladenosine(37)-N6)-methyltransferase TrmO [Thermococcus litoralis]EHR79100.1 hypothetical protein OCC_01184 [Thermococcus litoralis DSM 5473]
MQFYIKPIGVIISPYKSKAECPTQGKFSEETFTIEIFQEFEEGLKDIETCTHLIILYWLDRARRNTLIAIPPQDRREHGVFATRSPHRPNPIGFAVVELIERKGRKLVVKGLDAVDGTPVIDIKPYSSDLDCVENAKIGWFEEGKKE